MSNEWARPITYRERLIVTSSEIGVCCMLPAILALPLSFLGGSEEGDEELEVLLVLLRDG